MADRVGQAVADHGIMVAVMAIGLKVDIAVDREHKADNLVTAVARHQVHVNPCRQRQPRHRANRWQIKTHPSNRDAGRAVMDATVMRNADPRAADRMHRGRMAGTMHVAVAAVTTVIVASNARRNNINHEWCRNNLHHDPAWLLR